MTGVAIVGGGVVGTSVAYHLRAVDADVPVFGNETLGAASAAVSMAIFI